MLKSTTGTITSTETISLNVADMEVVLVYYSWASSVGTLYFGISAQDQTTLGYTGYSTTATGAPALVGNVAGTGGTLSDVRRYDVRGAETFKVAGAPGNSGDVTVKIQAYANAY